MIRNKSVHFLLILIFWSPKPVSNATFENVSVTLKLTKSAPPEKTVVKSDNRLDRNVDVQRAEIVTIERQNVPKLGENSVINLLRDKEFSIIRCRLEEIRPGAFKNLPKLETLDLSGNLLKEIRNGVFANLTFETLVLEDNQIAKIGDKAFNNLAMTNLFIDNNRITTWKSHWFDGTLVTGISMANNLIERLPKSSFEYLPIKSRGNPFILHYLILSGNRIKSIDPDAFEGLKEILNLDLQNNFLEYLEPGLFDSVAKIGTLLLGYNRIREIYYEAFRYTELTEFEIKGNLLKCVSTNIFDTTNLASLYIDGNPITCDCLNSWEQWSQKNKTLVIHNFAGLKQNCIDKSSTNKFKVSLLSVITLLILLFVIK